MACIVEDVQGTLLNKTLFPVKRSVTSACICWRFYFSFDAHIFQSTTRVFIFYLFLIAFHLNFLEFSQLFASCYLGACRSDFHMAQTSSAIGQDPAQPTTSVKVTGQSDSGFCSTSRVAGPGVSGEITAHSRCNAWDL